MSGPPLPPIFVYNRQRKMTVDLKALTAFARRALPQCALEPAARLTNLPLIEILLISDRKMSELHWRFLQISGPTDVITFQHGEIFISVETAERQAASHGTLHIYELQLYLVHGLLHLHGFDDQSDAQKRHMTAIQERILRSISCA